jgi:predicted DNA-binding antitoxin AbrB/MazE fold protein
VYKPLDEISLGEGTLVEVHVPTYFERLKSRSRSIADGLMP